jgi:hypothetical protein
LSLPRTEEVAEKLLKADTSKMCVLLLLIASERSCVVKDSVPRSELMGFNDPAKGVRVVSENFFGLFFVWRLVNEKGAQAVGKRSRRPESALLIQLVHVLAMSGPEGGNPV